MPIGRIIPSMFHDLQLTSRRDISAEHIDDNTSAMDQQPSHPTNPDLPKSHWSQHGQEEEPRPTANTVFISLETQSGWKVNIVPYNPQWPVQFETIKGQLHNIITKFDPPASYTAIEHIGSTSVQGLCGKPIIDILVTFACKSEVDKALEAFFWEIPNLPPYIRYTRIPDGGGIKCRESLKMHVPSYSPYYLSTPVRSVYLINENEDENPEGRVQIRCYRDLRDTLRNRNRNEELLQEYAAVKMELTKKVFQRTTMYAEFKNKIIRKILIRAGWTDVEVDEKEQLRVLAPRDDDVPY